MTATGVGFNNAPMPSNGVHMKSEAITTGAAGLPTNRKRNATMQPLDVINVPGALLKLTTLAQISGQSLSTLYRANKAAQLVLVKNGRRCTRVTSESARAYLATLGRGAA